MTGSIRYMMEKFKSLISNDRLFYGVLILLVGVASFGLGRMSVGKETIPTSMVQILEPVDIEKTSVMDIRTADTEVQHIKNAKSQINQESVSVAAVANSITGKEVSKESTTQFYVASKSGTKYHLASCPGAKQIKPDNRIEFATSEEARAAGYTHQLLIAQD